MEAVDGVVKDRKERYSLEHVYKAVVRKSEKKTSSYCYPAQYPHYMHIIVRGDYCYHG